MQEIAFWKENTSIDSRWRCHIIVKLENIVHLYVLMDINKEITTIIIYIIIMNEMQEQNKEQWVGN